jgi:hypothetical protein
MHGKHVVSLETGATPLKFAVDALPRFDRREIGGNSTSSPAMRLRQEDVAVTVSIRFSLAFALGLYVLQPSLTRAAEPPSREPSALPVAASANQQTADAIAAQLRQSNLLRHFDVEVSFRDGVAELSGTVANAGQREQVLRLVKGVAGVERVVDRMSEKGAIVPVQAPIQPIPTGDPLPPPGGAAPGGPAPAGPPPEATPIFQAPAPAPHDLNPPRMPPYAWPTYAPYNNFSRVAYPQAYPYNSWPFIGPMYPFPKVPPGWRAVKLQWDDGFWWYSKTASKYDWWKLRYY